MTTIVKNGEARPKIRSIVAFPAAERRSKICVLPFEPWSLKRSGLTRRWGVYLQEHQEARTGTFLAN